MVITYRRKQTPFLVLQSLVVSCGCSTLHTNRPLASQKYLQLFCIDSLEYEAKSGLNAINTQEKIWPK